MTARRNYCQSKSKFLHPEACTPKRETEMTIKLRLFIALGIVSVVLIGASGAGWFLLRGANISMKTVFDDRIIPLGDLKAVSDL
jgi:hypothetical protein